MDGSKQHLATLIDSWVFSNTHPGIVAGMYDVEGKEIFYHEVNSKKKGFCEGENAVGYNRDTIFRLYSMTKPIVVMAAMILVERGVLSLDDHVSKWISAFADTRVYVSGEGDTLVTEQMETPLTIKHLMTHTSGIVYGVSKMTACDRELMRNFGGQNFRHIPIPEMCNAIARSPLYCQPGKQFKYGLSTDVIGHIIELASGCKLNDFLHTEIFQPLGMVDTDFYVPEDKFARLAKSYDHQPASGLSFVLSPIPPQIYQQMPANLSGGGGLLGTLGDYAKFATCLLNNGEIASGCDDSNGGGSGAGTYLEGSTTGSGQLSPRRRLLSAESVRLMTSNQLPNNSADIADLTQSRRLEAECGGFGYGFAVSVLTDPCVAPGSILSGRGEFGWEGFASTFFFVDPVHKFSCVFMTQLTPCTAYSIKAHLRYMSHWLMKQQAAQHL